MATAVNTTRERVSSVESERNDSDFSASAMIARTMLGGLAGTVAITMMMYFVAPMMLGQPMDIAKMLGSMMGDNWWMGMGMHLMNGIVIFPLIYAFLLYRILPGAPVVKGITWGVGLWLLAQVVVMPMMGVGFFSGGMMPAMGSLMGHLAYGALLGVIGGSYSCKACSVQQ